MLNISENSIDNSLNPHQFNSFKLLKKSRKRRIPPNLIIIFSVIFVVFLFLPWRQNINVKGYVTTRSPEQRPQTIQSIIAGRLEKWYVKEGDYVNSGDTIAFISEIKSDYFDPELLERTTEQINAKSQSVDSYDKKVMALERQYHALKEALNFKKQQVRNKILQTKNKIKMDSIDLVASQTNLKIAENQLQRTQELYSKGLKTLTELQSKEYKVQSANAKAVVKENKLLNQRNTLINLMIELQAVKSQYADKLAKSQSDRQSALSSKMESLAETSKLKNKRSNYSQRKNLYYIKAPQSGYITKTLKKGIGETVKQGSGVATIMPAKYDLAVEVYVRPRDLPLLKLGDITQIRFDGWPTIVISGWPAASTGVFSGKVVAIDKFISSDKGEYRVLISPNAEKRAWPEKLSIGTGGKAFLLLDEVPIWYEIWRQLNGFPPHYYRDNKEKNGSVKRKAPIKSVK